MHLLNILIIIVGNADTLFDYGVDNVHAILNTGSQGVDAEGWS